MSVVALSLKKRSSGARRCTLGMGTERRRHDGPYCNRCWILRRHHAGDYLVPRTARTNAVASRRTFRASGLREAMYPICAIRRQVSRTARYYKREVKNMPVAPKVPRRQFHQSLFETMSNCGMMAYHRYILGIKRPGNAFLVTGGSVDDSVNMNLNTKIMSGELVKDSVIREFAATRFEERWGEDEIALDEEEKAEGRTLKDVQGEAKDKTVEL